MRIVLVVPAPVGQGVYWRAFHLGRQLVSMGERVRLICHQNGIKNPQLVDVEGLETVLLPTSKVFWRWAVWQLVNVLNNLRFALSFRPDVVHIFAMVAPSSALSTLGFRTLRFWKRFRTIVLVDWDDLWFDGRNGILRDYNFFIRSAGKLFEERSLFLGDGVVAVSDFLAGRARSLGVRRVFRITNGCDTENIQPMARKAARTQLSIPLHDPVLVHVGFTDFTAPFEIIRARFPGCLLFIVGMAPKYVGLRIPNLKDIPGIKYTGRQNLDRVKLHLAAADVLILIQENEDTERARWPIRLGDYLAAGRCVVSGRLGEAGKLISEYRCGLTAEPGSRQDFASCVLQLLENPAMRDECERHARAAAETLSWRRVAEDLQRVYKGSLSA